MSGNNESNGYTEEKEQDPRGLHVFEIDVTFRTDTNAWEYLRRLKIPVLQKDEDWSAVFHALPHDFEPGAMYLVGFAHSHPNEVHWGLQLLRSPDSDPPEVIVKSSELVGGYPGLLTALEREFSDEFRSSIEIERARVTYFLPSERWTPCILSHTRADPISYDGATLTLAQETWHVDTHNGILTGISVVYDEDGLVLTATASPKMGYSSTLLDSVEEMIWAAIRPLLVESVDTNDVEKR